MSVAFATCIVALLILAALGAPIALSMVVSAIIYLAIKGQDLGLAAEQMIQGIYDSFVILAVPLFIVAANIMNQGTITDKLLDFSKAVVGRFRGGMAQVDILVSLIFSGFTGYCGHARILSRLPWNRSSAMGQDDREKES